MTRRLRWRALTAGEYETSLARLESWPAPAGGAVRHMFALSALEANGPRVGRVASDDDGWALAVVFPGRLVVPCGDPHALRRAGEPTRRWRLLVGDAAASDAVLGHVGPDPTLQVHHQRYMRVAPDRVPDASEVADPGLRRAVREDVEGLAELAVRLHVDDLFGPDPGRAGLRGYGRRLAEGVEKGLVWVVGPVGAPVVKVERSVSSRRFGVQLAGIVVAPEARGEGLGRAAVAAAVRQALAEPPARRPVTLHVRAANDAALRAYAGAGFVDVEEWRLAVRG
ncbi:MAG: GNAT family N-acetyltransferase [Actinomycetes bacterium]